MEREKEREIGGGEKEIYFKELSHSTMGAGNSEICKISGQTEGSEKRGHCMWSPKSDCWQNFLFLRGPGSFLLGS